MRPVLIVGAGIAGLSAAIELAEQGQSSILISTMPSERAQSVMAEGGINAALNTKGQGDTAEEHFRDTMAAGCGLADPNAVRALTEGAPEVVRWLVSLGVAFNRTEDGEIDLRYFGGQKKQRTAFAQSSTGKQIVTALAREARKWEARGLIQRRSHHRLLKLLFADKKECTGCIVLDDAANGCEVLPGNVLLASGGMNGLFGKTTGSTQNSGAATALAYAAGAACANLEMIQYHPTTTPFSGKRVLISEAARGEGGRLFLQRGGEKWYFMEEKYPELKNLMPRDVVSREIEQVCREGGQKNAWLDMTGIGAAVFEEKLGDLREFCIEFLHLDPKTEYIPVYPGIHYFMGGLYVDAEHRTTVRHLYAAGECACQYHGANRLGGNSLLGAAFGGKRAARTILQDGDPTHEAPSEAMEQLAKEMTAIRMRREHVSCVETAQEMAEVMNGCLSIRRCEETLAAGAERLYTLSSRLAAGRDETVSPEEQWMLEQRLLLAEGMVESARARKESRGAQYRTEAPARDDAHFCKTTVARHKDGGARITFADIPKEGQPWNID